MKQNPIIKFLLIFSFAILAVVAGGCGGGSETSGGSSKTASGSAENSAGQQEREGDNGARETRSNMQVKVKTSSRPTAEFVKLANEICKRDKTSFLPEMGTYISENVGSFGSSNEAMTAAVRAVVLPKVEREIEEIRMLGVAPKDAKQVEAFLAALSEGISNARKDTSGEDGSEAGDQDGKLRFREADVAQANAQFSKAFLRSAQLARRNGLNECAYG